MSTARLRLTENVLDQGRLALIALLLVLAAIGWAVTGDRMGGMDAGPGTDLGTLGFYVSAWVVMMAAMMFPSIAPMVLVYKRIHARRRELGRSREPGATAVFVAGYLMAWASFGLAAYALLEIFDSLSIDFLSWDRAGRYLAGGVIVGASIYQLAPLKDVCLKHCRGPLDFILGHWRYGYGGGLRMGVEHGGWCVGCCWALMAALFALGVMSIGWMVFIAALIAIEKMLPWKALANRGIAVLLLTLGIAVAVVPGEVPGLTLPDSPEAREAMMQMEGGSMEGGSSKGRSMEGGSMEGSSKGGSMKDDSMKGGSSKEESTKGGRMDGGESKRRPMGGGASDGAMEP
jgi:predicted metal-binding membrane protein